MQVPITIEGQEIQVTISDCRLDEMKLDSYHEGIADLFEMIVSRTADRYADSDLTEDEYQLIIEQVLIKREDHTFSTYMDIISEYIASDSFQQDVSKAVEDIFENRAKYYTVSAEYSGLIEITVKANSAEQAVDYASNINHYDLTEYIETCDTEFDNFSCADEGCIEEPRYVNIVDATED